MIVLYVSSLFQNHNLDNGQLVTSNHSVLTSVISCTVDLVRKKNNKKQLTLLSFLKEVIKSNWDVRKAREASRLFLKLVGSLITKFNPVPWV